MRSVWQFQGAFEAIAVLVWTGCAIVAHTLGHNQFQFQSQRSTPVRYAAHCSMYRLLVVVQIIVGCAVGGLTRERQQQFRGGPHNGKEGGREGGRE